MELSVTGISFRSAPVELREQLALPGALATRWLRAARRAGVCEEAIVLNTCNRLEFYLVSAGRPCPPSRLIEIAAKITGRKRTAPRIRFYRHEGAEAVNHIFRVAASLDSQVVGEHEILGQVKEAYRVAFAAGTTGAILNKLLHRAFGVGKRVRTETQLCKGTASVPQAAADTARESLGDLSGKTALLVGAGQVAEQAAHALFHAGVTRLIIANRTLARARRLAYELRQRHASAAAASGHINAVAEGMTCPAMIAVVRRKSATPRAPQAFNVETIPLSGIGRVLSRTDLVLTSTGAPHPILTAADLGPHLRRRRRPLLILDLAVPRDVEPGLANFSAVRLRNIDDLTRAVERNLERRRREVPRAEALVRDEVGQFERWMKSLEAVPALRLLQEHFNTILTEELGRHRARFSVGDRKRLDLFAHSLCRKILHGPLTYLRQAPAAGPAFSAPPAAELVRRMFRLGSPEERA